VLTRQIERHYRAIRLVMITTRAPCSGQLDAVARSIGSDLRSSRVIGIGSGWWRASPTGQPLWAPLTAMSTFALGSY